MLRRVSIKRLFAALILVMMASFVVLNAQYGAGNPQLSKSTEKVRNNPYSATEALHKALERTLSSGGELPIPTITLVTVCPGAEVYELYGHASIRIKFVGNDFAINYGLFDFDTPNFAYRFVKGETDYLVDAYPMWLFMRDYTKEGRRVIEQELNLTDEQTIRLVKLIEEELKPENQTYRYNYVRENCSTKIVDVVEKAIGDTITFARPASEGAEHWTFRDIMHRYNEGYAWNDFGIDLVLGTGLDYPISNREKDFAPLILSEMMAKSTITDSIGNKIPVVRATRVLLPGRPEGCRKSDTPWLISPMAVFLLALVIAAFLFRRDKRRRRPTRWFDVLIFSAFGIAGLLLSFLIFFSAHEAVSPNWLYVTVNPLCFLGAFSIFNRRVGKAVLCYHWLNICSILVLLAILLPVTGQVVNGAMYPILAVAALRSATNIYIHRCEKKAAVKKVRA
ncbi:MAG: DUF4105 domain-containing protein [Muribaculaceae bacterium]|nr:DUF4105 domain-containing protein [Muribaculaceae bacterium]